MTPDLLTKHELSARLSISVRTLERLVSAGQFPSPQRRGRLSCWYKGAVEAWETVKRDQQIEAARTSAALPSRVLTESQLDVGEARLVNIPGALPVGQISASSSIYTDEELAASKIARLALVPARR